MERPRYLNSPRAKDQKRIASIQVKKVSYALQILTIVLLIPLVEVEGTISHRIT
jgi:hypothetical protein